MLILPVIKPSSYISYSSYSMWKRCQNQYYQFRMAGFDRIEMLFSQATGVGTYTEMFIKDFLIKKKNIDMPYFSLANESDKIKFKEDVNRETAITLGRDIAQRFVKTPKLIKRFLEGSEIHLSREMYKNFGGIPILGILDYLIDDHIVDLKTRGFNTDKSFSSPTPGYERLFDENGLEGYPYGSKIPLEEANRGWAEQFVFYNWLTGNDDYEYEIVEVTRNQKKQILFTLLKGEISKEFAEKLYHNVWQMWDTINNLNIQIEEPQPSADKCHAYGELCNVSHRCKKYMDTLGHPENMFLEGKL